MKSSFIILFFAFIAILTIPLFHYRKILVNSATTIGYCNYLQIITNSPQIDVEYNVNSQKYKMTLASEFVNQKRELTILYEKTNPNNAIIKPLIYIYAQNFMIIPFFIYFILLVFFVSKKPKSI